MPKYYNGNSEKVISLHIPLIWKRPIVYSVGEELRIISKRR